jgi:hypothetical protein
MSACRVEVLLRSDHAPLGHWARNSSIGGVVGWLSPVLGSPGVWPPDRDIVVAQLSTAVELNDSYQ